MPVMRLLRVVPLLVCCSLLGCVAPGREVTITARPADATIYIDGQERGRGPITERFTFDEDLAYHTIAARRKGFQEEETRLEANDGRDRIDLVLQPRVRHVTLNVTPVPAVVSVDGQPLSESRVSQISIPLTFTVDRDNRWVPHTVTAERPGYDPAQVTVRWTDQTQEYTLNLQPWRKDVTIVTDPPGAQIYLDGEEQSRGPSPVTFENFEIGVNPQTDLLVPRKVRAVKKGYQPEELLVSWEDRRTQYQLKLKPLSKPVRVATDPPGATVLVDGASMKGVALAKDESGASFGTLSFPPVKENGEELASYQAVAVLKTEDREYESAPFTIGWHDGQQEYSVKLTEITARTVPLLRPKFVRNGANGGNGANAGWRVEPERLTTSATRDVGEPGGVAVTRVGGPPEGALIDTPATSPDGSRLAFVTLAPELGGGGLRSQVHTMPVDGSASPRPIATGDSLNLMPSFSPDGQQILFSSDRAGGRRLSVWSAPADGSGEPARLTQGDSTDLWPTLDAAPRPHLYFERRKDDHPDPRLHATQLKADLHTDLGHPGRQPRVSPRADLVLFVAADPKTGKGDLCTVPVGGGVITRLTDTPDVDETDPAWSRDGTRVAFASDRGTKDGQNAGDYNLWVLDLAKPGEPIQVTRNESWDDSPVWDATGRSLFFRSNRGGQWGIWKIDVK